MEVKNNLITTIPFKGVQVRVEFTGGNSMKNIPAKFYTRDPFTQRALDSRDQLGRLYYLHQTIKEASDAPANAPAPAGNAAGTTAKGAGTAANAGKKAATTKKPDTKTVTTPPAPETPESDPPAGETAGTTANPGEGAPDAGEQDGDKLEFENLAAAITYVASKYGEQAETDAAVRKIIADKEGVKVVIHKGV